MKGVIAGLAVLPLAAWLAGFFPMDVARVCSGLVIVLVTREVLAGRTIELPRLNQELAGIGAVTLVAAAVAAHQLARVAAGTNGIDFAIFAQVAQSVADSGQPTTSLLGDAPINFLSHHFAPVLFVPGALSSLGVPAPVALVLAYGAAFAAALLALRRFGIDAGLPAFGATAWALVVALGQSIRPEMLWGVHDEIFALPLLGWALVFVQRKQWGRALALAALTPIAKESFFVFPAACAVLIHLEARRALPLTRKQTVIGSCVALLWVCFGAAYVFGQPLWSGRTFDHLGKFGFTGYLDADNLNARVWFVVFLLAPLALLPLVGRTARWWTIPAVPFIALNLVSSDPEMFRPTGYHAVVPAFLLGFAGVVGLQTLSKTVPRLSATSAVLVLLPLQLAFGATSLWIPLRELDKARWYPSPELVAALAPNASVAVDPAAAIALLGHGMSLRRVFALGEVPASQRPPFVVMKPGGWEQLEASVLADYRDCSRGLSWVVLCRVGP